MGHLQCFSIWSRSNVCPGRNLADMSRKFMDAQHHYQVYKQEMLAILEALLKWEDGLLGYCIHVVMDHKALEFLQMQL